MENLLATIKMDIVNVLKESHTTLTYGVTIQDLTTLKIDEVVKSAEKTLKNEIDKHGVHYSEIQWKDEVYISKSNFMNIISALAKKKIPLWFFLSLENVDLSARCYNVLKAAKFNYLYEVYLCDKNDLFNYRNFGEKSMKELKEVFAEYGVNF